MVQVDLEDRLGAGPAVLPGQQPLQLTVGAMAARNKAGGAGSQALRDPNIGDAFTERGLEARDDRGLVGIGLGLFLVLVDRRDQAEIEVALAERFERLA